MALAMRNYPEWSVAFWAAAAAGAVVVPLNAWWTGEELHYGLADSASTILICDQERAERIAGYLTYLPDLRTTIVARADRRDHRSGCGPLKTSSAASRQTVELPDVGIGPDDDATIFYTSGTTGRPKGALGTHRNICTNPMSLMYVNRPRRLAGRHRAGTAARTRICFLCRSSTPPDATRSW